MSVLTWGGLLFPSPGLSDDVARGFALLDASTDGIHRSKLLLRKAGHSVLKNFQHGEPLGCEAPESKISSKLHCCLANIFFNNQRKRTTVAAATDKVFAFKKSKREK